MVAFFICGTPSNNDGFQFVDLGPGHLPGLPASYLDRAPGEDVEDHRFEYGLRRRATLRSVRTSVKDQSERLRGQSWRVRRGRLPHRGTTADAIRFELRRHRVGDFRRGVQRIESRAVISGRLPLCGLRVPRRSVVGQTRASMLAFVVDGCAEAGSAQRRFVPGCRRETTHAGSRRNHRCRRRAPSALFRPRFGRVVVGRRQGARSSTRDRPSERNSSGAAGRTAERVAVLAGDHHRRRFRAHQEGSGVAEGCRRRRARGRTR